MKNIKIYTFSLFFFINIVLSNDYVQNIAFCLDSKGIVSRTGLARNGKLYKGDIIYNGDKIVVAENSFISFLNIYERSKVSVFENSTLKIFKAVNNLKEDINKCEIAIFGGKIIIDKIESNEVPLTIKSPSSSIYSKNSHFLVEYKVQPLFEDLSYCIFTVVRGNVIVENIKSKKSIYLKNGESILSTKEGKFLQFDTFRDTKIFHNELNQSFKY